MSCVLDWAKMSFYVSSFALFATLSICSYTDWKYRRIYNKVTLPSVALGLALAGIANFPDGLWNALLACLLAFTLFYLLFTLGVMGGGDVKLVAAIGALVGYPLIWDALFYGVVAGGIYALVVLAIKGGLWKILKNVAWFILGLLLWRKMASLQSEHSIKIPYGLCLAVGAACAYWLKHIAPVFN
jgi:prepilin peptidase CpaA